MESSNTTAAMRRPAWISLVLWLGLLTCAATAAACTYNFIPGNPLFCSQLCSKCESCLQEDSSFDDDNCYFENEMGQFSEEDCYRGCTQGNPPDHPMPPGWEVLPCEAFDSVL